MAAAAVENDQKLINEEYKIWKKNSPFLYDICISSALDWPSLTVQWLPDKREVKDDAIDYSAQRLLLGTHTADHETNHLIFAEVRLPTPNAEVLSEQYNDTTDIYGGFGGAAGKIEIIQRIVHEGEVNRARYMPQNADIIATKTKMGLVYLFNRVKHPSKPPKDGKCRPNQILKGHFSEGYGLDWNTFDEGLIISGANDKKILMWDIKKLNGGSEGTPLMEFTGHSSNVEDVCWHKKDPKKFASVSDDASIRIWDIQSSRKPQQIIANAHNSEINCCAFSPFSEHLLVTGSTDRHVALWDLRHTQQKLHALESHTGSIYQVEWSPHSETHIASSGADRRVMIWDLSQIGVEQSAEDAEDGPPELLFVHGGHTDKVPDFSWNHHDPWVIASVADNNIVQVWQMTDELLNEDDLTENTVLE